MILQGLGAVFLTGALLPIDAAYGLGGAPHYYIRLRSVEISPEGASAVATSSVPASTTPAPAADGGTGEAVSAGLAPAAIVSMARENLIEALRKRSEVVLELEGVAADAPAASYTEELKRRKLKGYEVTLRLLKLDRTVKPPPPGRKFRVLEQSVKLTLVGTIYPGEPMLALGGDGESTVQIDVGAQISEHQERDVLADALKDAIGQAVTQALRKLEIGPMKPPKDPPRRKK